MKLPITNELNDLHTKDHLFSKLEKLWRLIGTAISFSLFGIFGVLLGITVFPILWLTVRNARQRRSISRGLVSRCFWSFILIMRGLRVLDFKINGADSIHGMSHCLVVANHPSLIDVVFLIGLFPKIDCVVKSAMWSNPFTAATVRSAGYIRNDAPDILMEQCIERLKQGRNLILFPEGTRSEPNTKLAMKRGAATIAMRAEAKVVPVQISCRPTTLTKGEKWYQVPDRRPVFTLTILEPIVAKDYASQLKGDKIGSQNLTKDLQDLLSNHLEISV